MERVHPWALDPQPVQGLLELILKFLDLDQSILDDPLQPQEYAKSLNKFLAGNTDEESKEIVDFLSAVVQNSAAGDYDQQDIKAAENYEIRMVEAAGGAHILMVLIGTNWQPTRLQAPTDSVRLEVESAHKAGVTRPCACG